MTHIALVVAYGAVVLEGIGVLATSIAVCGGAGIAGAQLSRKSVQETTQWFYWGTTVGFVFGVPLTICSFVLLQRSS